MTKLQELHYAYRQLDDALETSKDMFDMSEPLMEFKKKVDSFTKEDLKQMMEEDPEEFHSLFGLICGITQHCIVKVIVASIQNEKL